MWFHSLSLRNEAGVCCVFGTGLRQTWKVGKKYDIFLVTKCSIWFRFSEYIFLCRTFCSVRVVSAFSLPSSALCPLWPAVSTYSLWTLCTWWDFTFPTYDNSGIRVHILKHVIYKRWSPKQFSDTNFPSSWPHIALVQSTQNAPLLRMPSWPTSWTLRSLSHLFLHPPIILPSTPAALKQMLKGTTKALKVFNRLHMY